MRPPQTPSRCLLALAIESPTKKSKVEAKVLIDDRHSTSPTSDDAVEEQENLEDLRTQFVGEVESSESAFYLFCV
ncbi:hypothetical protein VKT23_020211 [Stygiomarasmius scandens]|uniref:Uncharacterized protein n=1 Tax=Marasmiellus scandens TaxID=2682957 RepID=A0ABR1IJJ6_9AGAR